MCHSCIILCSNCMFNDSDYFTLQAGPVVLVVNSNAIVDIIFKYFIWLLVIVLN